MSKKNRKTNSIKFQQPVDSKWVYILGAGYEDKNVAYDFGKNEVPSQQFSARADALRNRIASLRAQSQQVVKLEAEVEYLSSPAYSAKAISKWFSQNAASAAYLTLVIGVIAVAVVRIIS